MITSQQKSPDARSCVDLPIAETSTKSSKKLPFVESFGVFLKRSIAAEGQYVECVSLPYQFCSTQELPFHPKASINVKPGTSFTLRVYAGFEGVIGQFNYHDIEFKRPPIEFIFSTCVEHLCTIVVPDATDVVAAPAWLHFKSDRHCPNQYKIEFDYSVVPELRHLSNFVVDFSLNSDYLRIWFDMKKGANSSLQILPFSGSV
ncbi:hypothetical protein GEMRC1_008858 [Eukaryota sp. GEM-RC1]